MSRYANNEDRECLLETLSCEEDKETFLYGFYSAIAFAFYKGLDNDQKELWCPELFERVCENYGNGIMEDFLKEHMIDFQINE